MKKLAVGRELKNSSEDFVGKLENLQLSAKAQTSGK